MLNVEGSQVHLMDKGMGPPVLFLHGNPDTSDVWSGLIEHIQSEHRCLAPDLPGYGCSIAAQNFDCSLERLAGFVDGLVLQAGLTEPLHLVVHDIGGQFGLAWAVKWPEKVRSLTIFNTAFSPDYEWTTLHKIWRTPFIGELAQRLTSRRAFTRERRQPALHRANRSDLRPDHPRDEEDGAALLSRQQTLSLPRVGHAVAQSGGSHSLSGVVER
jgi:pimeloyl-ACP methyl ester carboxylesterase